MTAYIAIYDGHIEERPETPPFVIVSLDDFGRENEASAEEVRDLQLEIERRGYAWLGGGAAGPYTLFKSLPCGCRNHDGGPYNPICVGEG